MGKHQKQTRLKTTPTPSTNESKTKKKKEKICSLGSIPIAPEQTNGKDCNQESLLHIVRAHL